jgi:hypothetical protein
MIGLAHALGIRVTAEGVERPSQAAHLLACGCDTAQGWLYDRPMPWAALAPRLGAVTPAPAAVLRGHRAADIPHPSPPPPGTTSMGAASAVPVRRGREARVGRRQR